MTREDKALNILTRRYSSVLLTLFKTCFADASVKNLRKQCPQLEAYVSLGNNKNSTKDPKNTITDSHSTHPVLVSSTDHN